MGHVEVAHLSHALPDGRVLLEDASLRVGEGAIAALVGPNGAGKTTLIRLIAGDLTPQSGTVTVSGGLGVMRQFVGGIRGAAQGHCRRGGARRRRALPSRRLAGGSGGSSPRASTASAPTQRYGTCSRRSRRPGSAPRRSGWTPRNSC